MAVADPSSRGPPSQTTQTPVRAVWEHVFAMAHARYLREKARSGRGGLQRNRNEVSICNSDPTVMSIATRWLGRLTKRRLRFSLQYHADQDPDELHKFWGTALGTKPDAIKLQRKSNSNQMAGRQWRSRHGVIAVRVPDTLLRARLQAWMDCLRAEWQ